MANGTIHKLGTLYINRVKRPFPTKPWRTDSKPTGTPSVGDILNYDNVNGDIEIRDTDSDDAYKLRWIEVNDGSKRLLISDRCILTRVTWDELNTQGLVNGKEITIDGQKYKIRLLSGGNNYRSGSDNFSGGTPTTNEWDRIIVNEGSFSGLPKPTSTNLDNALNSTDFESNHNNIWNWYCMLSWCKETYSGNSNDRVTRGDISTQYFIPSYKGSRNNFYGWRPVLEVPNSAPTINGLDENLGSFTSPLIKQYSISDIDNDKLSVTEKLDGVTIKSLTNQNSGTSITLDLTNRWNDISYDNHIIEIIVTDSNGLSSTVTITFNKIKPPIQPIPTTSSLKQAINHSKEIDKEIEYLLIKLKNNLINNNIEVLENDKMGELIDKVSTISRGSKISIERGFIYDKSVFSVDAGYGNYCLFVAVDENTAHLYHKQSDASDCYEYKINLKAMTIEKTRRTILSRYFWYIHSLHKKGKVQFIHSIVNNAYFNKIDTEANMISGLTNKQNINSIILSDGESLYDFYIRSSSWTIKKYDELTNTWSIVYNGKHSTSSSLTCSVFYYKNLFYIFGLVGTGTYTLFTFDTSTNTVDIIKENISVDLPNRHHLHRYGFELPTDIKQTNKIIGDKLYLFDSVFFTVFDLKELEFIDIAELNLSGYFKNTYANLYNSNCILNKPLAISNSDYYGIDMITIL